MLLALKKQRSCRLLESRKNRAFKTCRSTERGGGGEGGGDGGGESERRGRERGGEPQAVGI